MVTTRDNNYNSVATPCLEYQQMAAKWKLPDTLMSGVEGMRAASTTYLPQEPNETDAAYEIRLARTPLYNAFRRTVDLLVSKVFATPIKVGADLDKTRADELENIDLEGRDIDQFAYDMFYDAIVKGLTHVLIDYPVVEPGTTLADIRDRGVRPYLTHIKASNLIGWQVGRLKNGAGKYLKQIRILEAYLEEDPDDEFNQIWKQRVRVIKTDTWEIWEAADIKAKAPTGNILKLLATGSPTTLRSRGWSKRSEGPNTLGVVPLATFYTSRKDFMVASPALDDLAELNLEHWLSASDQKHILHVARVPLLFSKDLQAPPGEKITIGPNRMINGGKDSDLKYVEHNGAGIGAGQTDLDKIEEKMRLYGLELLVRKGGNPTATGRSLDSAEVNNPLQRMAQALQDTLEFCLQIMNLWEKKDITTAGTLIVNKNYGLSQSEVTDLQMLTAARARGDLSLETYWSELGRRETLSEDFDSVKERAAILKEAEDKMVQQEKELALQAKFKPEPAAGNKTPANSGQ